MNEMLNNAIEYAKLGISIIPLHSIINNQCTCGKGYKCDSPGKHPRTKNGVKDASKDPEQIKKWWSTWPNSNIGIATGTINGLFVVDIDGEIGDRSFNSLTAMHGAVPDSVTQITGSGGKHLLFKHPGGIIKNGIAVHNGIDIRGDGGYIVAAPSIHKSGSVYQWEFLQELGEIELAELPDLWIKALKITPEAAKQSTADSTQNNTEMAAANRVVPEGQRNATLFKYGCSLWEKGMSENVISAMLYALNSEQCIPPLADNEVETIIKSITNRYAPGDIRVSDKKFDMNDFGLGERFVHHCGDKARYCKAWGTWLLWDGKRWRPDSTGEVEEWGRQVIRRIPEEALNVQEDEVRSKILKFAAFCCRRNSLDNMLRMAQTMPGIPVTPDQLDNDIWLLNCQNGTINLKTGKLQEHNPNDMITKITDTEYTPGATAPIFKKFLNRIFAEDQELIEFLKRAAGYSLTGSTSEQVLFPCWGSGANGKSTLINIICSAIGDYGTSTPMSTFVDRQAGAATNDIARMKGLRLITALETNTGGQLDEGTIKLLTGSDPVTARFLHKEFFEFMPTFKFWLGFNHKPVIKSQDHGIWRRIKLIPFEETISDDEKDKDLPEKLKKELPGILAWMIEGCLEWQRVGLKCPHVVEAATDEYRSDMDIFGDFLNTYCVQGSNYKVTSSLLYQKYRDYCYESGLRPLSAKKMSAAMKERGFKTLEGRSRSYYWIGIDISNDYIAPEFLQA